MRMAGVWSADFAIHRGEVDGVILESAAGDLSTTGTWDDLGIEDHLRGWLAERTRYEPEQIEFLNLTCILTEVDDSGLPV